MGDPIVLRWKESEDRPRAAAALREALNTYLTAAQGEDEKYSHIEESEKAKVVSRRFSFHVKKATLTSL